MAQAHERITSSSLSAYHHSGEGPVIWRMLTYPPTRRALLVGCGLQMFQQLSGINTVIRGTRVVHYTRKRIKATSFQTKDIPSRWYCSDHNANSRDRPRSPEGAFVINTGFNQQTGDVRVDPGLLIGGAQLWRWAAGRSG
ncbi:Proton myo-inositol cotransporter [Liparis tanakae]|uniref:Proton myo-inositol cotransporter n=1 Tax=Liparis tanakae TaxID=230148 RepID=A0A4Z2GNU2_9TELE|nr:Proton myo-inositol cotransporter [Liparis tanakae]